jgi:hypothetical protein
MAHQWLFPVYRCRRAPRYGTARTGSERSCGQSSRCRHRQTLIDQETKNNQDRLARH